MKSNLKIIVLILVLITSCLALPRQTEAQQPNVSFQIFYDQLSPYGQWINFANYGYVWLPDAGSDFVPYSTDGHWVLTQYGWTWASNYIWGWATFHYGRWSFNNSVGWFWVPDNEWGPAWVNWRQADHYYGWAPMEPGISVSMSFNREYDNHNDHWLFVDNRDFERTDVNHYYVNRSDHDRIIRNSIIINNTYIDNSRHITYVTGPSRESVQHATGRDIRPLSIHENNKPGQEISNGQLRIYRPQVEKNNRRKTAPTRITNINDIKRKPTNDATNQIGNPGNRSATNPENVVNPRNSNNNNVQPGLQRNLNQQDNNKQVQQNRPISPINVDRNIQPNQAPRTTPADNTRPIRQPNNEINRDNSQPVQQRNQNSQNNTIHPTQQRDVNQQVNKIEQRGTTPVNIDTKRQPLKPQRVNQNNNNNNNRSVKQDKSIKQQIKQEQDRIPNTENEKK